MQITTATEAQYRANQFVGNNTDLKPIERDGETVGWTFRVPGPRLRHGWVLTDGRVSPATETYRAEAEAYALATLED